MNASNFPRITIPKPCHEDWGKMTPDEQGAFCKVCNKSVIDFSNKKAEEVNAILIEKAGEKMCGRFRNEQVAQPVKVEIPLWMLPRQLSPVKAFLVALLVTFGTTLVSCTNTDGQMVGKIALAPDSTKHKDCSMVKGETKREEIHVTMGLMRPPSHIPNPVDSLTKAQKDSVDAAIAAVRAMKDSLERAEEEAMAEMLALKDSMEAAMAASQVPDSAERIADTLSSEDEILSVLSDTTAPDTTRLYTVGYMEMGTHIYNDDVENVSPVDTVPDDSVVTAGVMEINREGINESSSPELFHLTILSNPTFGKVNLKLLMNVKANMELDLYDLTGRKMRSFMPLQKLDEGEYDLSFDISALPSGNYLCIACSDNYMQSPRIVLTK